MATRSTHEAELDKVVINLAVYVDLRQYAEGFGLAGPRSARDDLKQIVLQAVRDELERMGIPRSQVDRQR